MAQLFKRSIAAFFARHFLVNTIYREQFHVSIYRRLEKHLNVFLNNPLMKIPPEDIWRSKDLFILSVE